jgi:uncharacterized protein YaaQ
MKLVLAIVQDKDAGPAVEELISHGYRVTRINTAGGFLKRGNATILIGVEDGEVNDLVQLLRDICREPTVSPEGISATGVVFVLPVNAAYKF